MTAARDRLAEALAGRWLSYADVDGSDDLTEHPDRDGARITREHARLLADALLPVVAEIAAEQAAEAVELAALIVENATGIGSVSDEQLGQLAQSIREIPQYRARAAALAPDNGGPQ